VRFKLAVVTAITATRFFSVPIVLIFSAKNDWQVVAPLLLTGVLTDLLDGKLARGWSVASRFGRFLDIQSDRLLLAACIAGMIFSGALTSAWIILVASIWLADLMTVIWPNANGLLCKGRGLCYNVIGIAFVKYWIGHPSVVLIVLAYLPALVFMLNWTKREEFRQWRSRGLLFRAVARLRTTPGS